MDGDLKSWSEVLRSSVNFEQKVVRLPDLHDALAKVFDDASAALRFRGQSERDADWNRGRAGLCRELLVVLTPAGGEK